MGNVRAIGLILAGLCAVGCEASRAEPMPQGTPLDPAAGAGGAAGAQPGAGAGAGEGGLGGTSPIAGAGADTSAGTGGAGGVMVMVPAGTGGAGGVGGVGGAPAEPEPLRASIRVPQVAAGEEGTVCVQVRLDNAEPVRVVRLHNVLSPASHHFIVSKVTDPAGGEESLAPCVAFRGAIRGAPLTITQKADDDIVLPPGVSYDLGASQVMHLELHYLNASEEPVDIVATTELYIAPADAQLQEATVLLVGTGDIAIGPRTSASTGPKFTALPEGMDGVRFFAITGHTHRFGTNVEVSSAANDGRAETLLYAPEPFLWDAPEMKHLEPAIEVPAGGGFSFECEWENPTDDTIGFGESALAEMCFFWAYYYPKKPVTNVLLDGIDLSLFLGL